MSRTIDPAEALVMLKQHQPNFDRMKAAEIIQQNRDMDEIAMLERRVQSLCEEVDLGNGDTIRVRTALSEVETAELGEIERRITSDISEEEKIELAYRQLELLTFNPLLTADWFRENRDKWPMKDGLGIILGFAERQFKQNRERFDTIQQFRNR